MVGSLPLSKDYEGTVAFIYSLSCGEMDIIGVCDVRMTYLQLLWEDLVAITKAAHSHLASKEPQGSAQPGSLNSSSQLHTEDGFLPR